MGDRPTMTETDAKPDYNEMLKQRKPIWLDYDLLNYLMRLPDGYGITSVQDHPGHRSVSVNVIGPDLDYRPHDEETRLANAHDLVGDAVTADLHLLDDLLKIKPEEVMAVLRKAMEPPHVGLLHQRLESAFTEWIDEQPH